MAARLARACGLTLATNIRLSEDTPFSLTVVPFCPSINGISGCASSELRTSVCDCSDTKTASADVTQPEQARQSVSDISAGAWFSGCTLSSVVTSYGSCRIINQQAYRKIAEKKHTSDFCGSFGGRVSTGFMHATPGEMKSLRSSDDRIALIAQMPQPLDEGDTRQRPCGQGLSFDHFPLGIKT